MLAPLLFLAAIASPPGCGPPTYDNYDNRWALCGNKLFVLPAQSKPKWIEDNLSGLPAGAWRHLAIDDFGFLWIASATKVLRLDPRFPEKGWADASIYTTEGIAKIATGPRGSLLATLTDGYFADIDLDRRPPVLKLTSNVRTLPPAWGLAARLPGANHDLSGDVMKNKFYVAGGQTAEWGYPAVRHIFDELLEFDGTTLRTAAKLTHPRYYNATSHLDGKVWIIGGCVRDKDWQAHDLDTVEIWDPTTQSIAPGPKLPAKIEMAAAQNIAGRIYVAGAPLGALPASPLPLYSIGPGESAWRNEPDGPPGRKNIAAVAVEGKFYVLIPDTGLSVFDPATKRWTVLNLPERARSSQLAAHGGEIWIMGGRDIPSQSTTLIYNPKTGNSRRGPELPRELSWGVGFSLQGKLYLAGGAGGIGSAAGRCYSNRIFRLK